MHIFTYMHTYMCIRQPSLIQINPHITKITNDLCFHSLSYIIITLAEIQARKRTHVRQSNHKPCPISSLTRLTSAISDLLARLHLCLTNG